MKDQERDSGGQEAREEAGEMVLSREGEAHWGVGGEREDGAAAGAGQAKARCRLPTRTVQRTEGSSVRDSGYSGVTWQSPRCRSAQHVGVDGEWLPGSGTPVPPGHRQVSAPPGHRQVFAL